MFQGCDRIDRPIIPPDSASFRTTSISPILIVEGYTRYIAINDLFGSIYPLTVTAQSEDKM